MDPKAISVLVGGYVALRDKKKAIKKRHSEELAPINEKMEKIENAMQRFLLDSTEVTPGEDPECSIRTANGTAYLSTRTEYVVEDPTVLYPWVEENHMLELMQARVTKEVVEGIVESTGKLPPGVKVTKTISTNFRR